MVKAVHIINAMEVGGVEVGVLSLLKSKLDPNYIVITVKGCDKSIFDSLSKDEKDRLYICNGYFNVIKELIRLKPKYVISSLWRAHLISSIYKLLFFRVKRVHFTHSGRFAHILDMLITKFSVFTAYEVFCDCEKTKEWVGNHLNYNGSLVLPMNVSFTTKIKSLSFFPYSFVYVGRFSIQKNIEKSLEFIHELKSTGLVVSFDLYGRDDGTLDDLKQYCNSLSINDVVTFHESLLPTEIEIEMQKYNFYLQTSTVEGMAISVFQSIKNGLFPIVTPVGEIQNYTNDGYNACYIDPNDITGSASKFLNMLSSENINKLEVGKLVNEQEYQQFDQIFFDTLKTLSNEH
ncbi:glycosyltransferase [Escherichia coli]|uniref:glycosyltransferase n=1 Tax=Escherichia coli TaxID=562 RepID=UPI000DA50237|nr:glycosyltransferase [Escherichia coli]MBY7175650.1 glycosyltransferase [Escherichia coli]MBY7184845.1 glycosyltransferase [Escherichia coli]MBY7212386.1 glycosyltransferase [Escherichia coli]MBY7371313.1 glycosyltransferase [Escherichia coli]MBY7442527.1 glycosyltransferase [Escherichia coli]